MHCPPCILELACRLFDSSLQQPNCRTHNGAHHPESGVFQQVISLRPTARAGGIAGAIIRPIRQRPIQNQRLRPIHIPIRYSVLF